MKLQMLGLVAAAGVALVGCRTAGEARTAHHVVIENSTVGGDVYVDGGAASREVSQTAGKEVGVTGAAAQAVDNAVGVGGSSANREGQGGNPVQAPAGTGGKGG